MKKFLVSAVMLAVFAVVLPFSVSAQDSCRRNYRSSRYDNAYYGRNDRSYRRSNKRRNYSRRRAYSYSRRPSFYRRHRNVINIALGTGGGALIGGMLGGRKGALIGALAGAGGSALYTYKLNPKKRRYYRR
ncbi:MAG: hypothetical protein AB7F88_06540 [Pyrinomonadaceae bacterium]